MPPAGGKTTPPIFFPEKENGRCDRPKERRFPLRASSSKKCGACRLLLPCARRCRVSIAIRFASAPIIRCRSADLVGVQTNFRLPPVSTMRRAKQCRYFASSLPPSKRHSRLTTVRRGCKWSRLAGVHGEAMYTALTLRSACSSSSCKPAMSGVEGDSPRISLGVPKGGFSLERESPL